MKKTQNKGFTLVELIIVITILAILATIAFVSFSGYAGQSRDAKKQSELSNLKNKIEVAIAANSQDVLSFVEDNTLNKTVSFAWTTPANDKYKAWKINYPSLWAESSKYKFTYWIWAVKNDWGSFYQLATKLEDDSVYTTGNYSPRKFTTNTFTAVASGTDTLTLTWANIGKLRVGDTVNSKVITKVSSDLSKYTYTGAALTAGTVTVVMADESDLLVASGSLVK